MRKMIATIAATVLLGSGVTLVTLATAPPASAAPIYCQGASMWYHVWNTTDSANGGTVCINEEGDIVYLCDTAADGYAPRVEIAAQSSSGQYDIRYRLTASGGNGTCVHARASDGAVYDLPEENNVGVQIWLGPDRKFLDDHVFYNDNFI